MGELEHNKEGFPGPPLQNRAKISQNRAHKWKKTGKNTKIGQKSVKIFKIGHLPENRMILGALQQRNKTSLGIGGLLLGSYVSDITL
jgi:hypothetical protein